MPESQNPVLVDKDGKELCLKNPRLLSSLHGKINELIMVCPEKTIGLFAIKYAKIAVDLIKKMPAVRFYLYGNPKYIDFIRKKLVSPSDRSRVVTLAEDKELNNRQVWVQDAFLVVESNQKTYLVSDTSDEALTKDIVTKLQHFDPKYEFARWSFLMEGGNYLVGDKHIYIGLDEVPYLKEQAYEQALKALDKSGRTLVFLGKENCLNENKALIRQNLLKRIKFFKRQRLQFITEYMLENIGTEDISSYCNDTACQTMMHIDRYITLGFFNGIPQVLVAKHKDQIVSQQCEDLINANTLPRLTNQSVHRLPFIFKGKKQAMFNNAIVEVGAYARIWVPDYNFVSVDDRKKVIQVLTDAGFKEVVFVGNFGLMSLDRGALHCIVKVLDRN